jgi:hypothetical protein
VYCIGSCTKNGNNIEEISKDCEELKDLGIIDSFPYPIRPGTIEWENLENQDAKWNAVNVPTTILEEMCTHGLVYTCVYCPLFILLTVYNDIHTGFVSLSDHINSFAELINRNDAGTELFNFYKTMFDTTWQSIKQAETQIQIIHTEIFFAQQEYLGKLNDTELSEVVLEAFNRLLNKETNQMDIDCINGSHFLISNILYYNLEYEPLIGYIDGEALDGFLNNFMPINDETRDSLKYYTDLFLLDNK